MTDLSLDDLRDELSDFAKPLPKRPEHTPQQERVIAGFEDILRFHDEHGRAPIHGEDRDIFERLYAVRLDRLRALDEFHEILAPMDEHRLLDGEIGAALTDETDVDTDALLDELKDVESGSDITKLTHVMSREERRAADEVANRERCEDFDKFEPLFEQVQKDIETGIRSTRSITKDAGFLKADIATGQFFILGGQTAYIAQVGETIKAPNGQFDARLRVIFSNGTESNLLRRSMQRALYKDDTGRRITDADAGPLFGKKSDDDDTESGTIYVLRSLSDRPEIAENRQVLHKIGVTGGSVEKRIANAKKDATYLLADVEIVQTYKLFNINRNRLEGLLQKLFSAAQLDIEIEDRFGNPVKPREWFLVPMAAIDEAVTRIEDGSITNCQYDPDEGRLVSLEQQPPE